jgi:hypothetical protein
MKRLLRWVDWETVGLLVILIACLTLVFVWIVLWILGTP